jgi:anti-sigma regulatory factor (Ser/Thr protein kinase)
VLWRDMTVAGRNPGRIIPTVLLAFADIHPGRRVRIIGEPIWAGRTRIEYPACAQHEALINAAFAGRPATILCPYDVARLDPAWVDDAYRTHPIIWDGTARFDSRHYADPVRFAADVNQPVPDPPPHAVTMDVDMYSLASVRRFVADQATRAGLPARVVADGVVAVNEVAANTVEHGGGNGRVAVWFDGHDLICQVTDTGQFRDPLAGRIPVAPDATGKGRGLLLVNQLCDLVRIHTAASGSTVRLHLCRTRT